MQTLHLYNKAKSHFSSRLVIIVLCLSIGAVAAFSQSISPVFYVTNGETSGPQTEYTGSAPIVVNFDACPEDFDDPAQLHYKWSIYNQTSTSPIDVRQGTGMSQFSYTFTASGSYSIQCEASLGNDKYPADNVLSITVQPSHLEFPNAFSPNGDGINDTYRAKPGTQSITEFKAAIFNRQGQMLFRFRDVNDEWDGTYKGRPVKDGVYFLNCEAKGADGQKYTIRRDINILRGFIENDIAN